jgi:hypothetical protein
VFSLAAVVLVVGIVFRHAGVVVATLVSMVGGYAAVILGIGATALYLSRRNTSGPTSAMGPATATHRRPLADDPGCAREASRDDRLGRARPLTPRDLRLPRVGRARRDPAHGAPGARAHERTGGTTRATRPLAARLPLRRRGRPRPGRRRRRRDGLPRRPRQRDPTQPLRRRAHLVAVLHVLHLHPAGSTCGRQHRDARGAED